jgi:hypothetical protein
MNLLEKNISLTLCFRQITAFVGLYIVSAIQSLSWTMYISWTIEYYTFFFGLIRCNGDEIVPSFKWDHIRFSSSCFIKPVPLPFSYMFISMCLQCVYKPNMQLTINSNVNMSVAARPMLGIPPCNTISYIQE